jgi:hypothetical protein
MRKLLTLFAFLALAGTARADFVLNNTSLTTSKQDLFPLQPGSNPNNFVTASDYNAATQASLDLRSALTAGSYHGLLSLSSDPLARTLYPTSNYLWYKNDGTLHFNNGSDHTISFGGGGVTWPLTNGTSPNTYTSAVADGAAAHQQIFDGTGCATDGCMAYEFRSGTNNWFTVGRASGAHKFTFSGDADATGAGPVLIKSSASSAGLTLDATTAGGRIYQQYSTSAGLYVLADLTAGANRWAMDANGAYYPYADNAVNLGLPGNRPAALYTYQVDAAGTFTQNIASVTGQQAGMSTIASTAAAGAGSISNSPGLLFGSQAWNTSALAGQRMDWLVQAIPTNGNPVTGQLSVYSNPNATGYTERFRITPTRATALNGFVVTQGFAKGYRTAATTVTVATTDVYVGVTGTGARTVNLPAANTCLAAGQEFVIQEQGNDVGTITINRASTDTINGATTTTIAAAFGTKTLVCNGSNAWFAR